MGGRSGTAHPAGPDALPAVQTSAGSGRRSEGRQKMSLQDGGMTGAVPDGGDMPRPSWQTEESAAERFLRGAVAADPRLAPQALSAALQSAPAEAESLIALALRLVPQHRDAILQVPRPDGRGQGRDDA